ncbi:type IV pilus biogenesis/stability protein PilW [Alteromonas sp. CYL-A6]|uniref:type IV pilus biogenesis/stability protein PilW n=1 Tax=Alteromonas nitratireducens TaxID=3390813 RepID=UPI0034BC30C1
MRITTLALVALLGGCVSQPQTGTFKEEFDKENAAKTRVSLGLTYLKNGNYSQAKANLDRALEYAPRSADVHYSLAYYYQLVGENERADESYNTAIKLAPRNADIANSYGAFLCQTGNYNAALNYFQKAINNKLYANSAETYENMALCAQQEGRNDVAIGYLQDALNHQPARAKSLILLAELYAKENQWENANATLKKFERVGQVTPDYLWLAVSIAEAQGDIMTAKEYGEMLMAVYPTHPLSAQYRQKARSWPQVSVSRKTKNTAEPAAALVVSEDPVVQQPVAEVSAPRAQQEDTSEAAAPEPESPPVVVTSQPDEPVSPESDTVTADVAETVPDDGSEGDDENAVPRFHIVKASENLYRISLKYNIKMATLQEWNDIKDNGAIFAGKKLWLVPPEMQEN